MRNKNEWLKNAVWQDDFESENCILSKDFHSIGDK